MPVLTASTAPVHELGETLFTSLATPSRGTTDTSVWRARLAPGTPGTPHRLTREEIFVVVSGRATVALGDEVEVADPGDVIVVPPDSVVSIANDGTEALEMLCCQPVGGQARIGADEPFTPPWAQ